jgi:hypothetical protein
MDNQKRSALTIIAIILVLIFTALIYDGQDLTHHTVFGTVVDKNSDTRCSAFFDDKGNWAGESCNTDYFLSVESAGEVKRWNIGSSENYKSFAVQDAIRKDWDTGKLVLPHNLKHTHP